MATDIKSRSDRANVRDNRLQVRVSGKVHEILRPLFDTRTGASTVTEVAAGLGIVEANRWLSLEPKGNRYYAAIWLMPDERVTRKAASYYVKPELLYRAAAVKIAFEIEEKRNLALLADRVGSGAVDIGE